MNALLNNYMGWFMVVNTGSVLTILGLLLHQHKVWIRVKDRMNAVWRDYLERHGRASEYIPLEHEK